MTLKSVYFIGDIGDQNNPHIIDVDTGQELMQVESVTVTVSARRPMPEALIKVQGKAPVFVGVVKNPNPGRSPQFPKTPTTLSKGAVMSHMIVTLEEEYEPTQSATRVTATLRKAGQPTLTCARMVPDWEVAKSPNIDVVEQVRHTVLQDLLQQGVINSMSKRSPAQKVGTKFQAGGAVPLTMGLGKTTTQRGLGVMPSTVEEKKPCEECGGSGEIHLFSSTQKCSSCTPQGD